MKNKMQLFALSSLLAFSFFMTGCEKDEVSPLGKNEISADVLSYQGHEISITDGRLVFPSLEVALFFDHELKENPEVARPWFNQISNYTSANSAYHNLTEEDVIKANGNLEDFSAFAFFKNIDGELFLDPVIDDPATRYMANQDGVFQIGDEIYHVFRDFGITVDVQVYFSTPMKKLLNNHASVRRIPITRRVVGSLAKVNIDQCRQEYGNNRRVTGEIEERTVFLSSTVNCIVRTKHHRKGFLGAWYGEKADQLSQIGCLSVNGNNGLCFSVDKSLSNRQEIDKTFFSGTNAFISGGNTVRHTAVEGGTNGECFSQAPE